MLRGLWQLSRPVPLLAWSGCAIILGVTLALGTSGKDGLLHVPLIMVIAWLLQGLVAHAANDVADSISGTDARSPGVLSGGSRVLQGGLLTPSGLKIVERLAIGLAILLSLYLCWLRGAVVLLLLLLGLWSCLAYSLPPLRLAYHPWLGELGCAFPGVVTVTVGTYYLITGTLSELVWYLAILHGLCSIGWLMVHHLPDIPADLAATPSKITTPAWVHTLRGPRASRYPAMLYFSLALLWSIFLTVQVKSQLAVTIPCTMLCLHWAYICDPQDLQSTTKTELRMIGVVCVQTLLISLLYWK